MLRKHNGFNRRKPIWNWSPDPSEKVQLTIETLKQKRAGGTQGRKTSSSRADAK